MLAELETIDRADTAEKALAALEVFSQGPGARNVAHRANLETAVRTGDAIFAYPAEV